MSTTGRRLLAVGVFAVAAGGLALTRPGSTGPTDSPVVAGRPAGAEPVIEAVTTTLGPPRSIGNRVFLLGDSVLQGAAPDVAARLRSTWSVTSDTRVGRFLDEGVRVAHRRRGDVGDVVVVGLGNNYGGDEVAFADQVDELLDELRGADHVLWLTVSEFRDDRREVNDALRAAARRDPRLVLVDWVPSWRRNPDYTAADRLHLTPEGAAAMAALVERSIAQVLRAANEHPVGRPAAPELEASGSIPVPTGSGRSPSVRSTSTSEPEEDPPVASSPEPPSTTEDPPGDAAEPPSTTPPSSVPATVPATSTPG